MAVEEEIQTNRNADSNAINREVKTAACHTVWK